MADLDDVRHGVFLTPDARTSAAVTAVTGFVRAQFGLVSAGAFPPHVTLAGSLPLQVDEDDLVATVRAVAASRRPFPVQNNGIGRLGDSVVYDVHDLDGEPNAPLVGLVEELVAALRPLLRPVTGLPPDLRDREDWRGHLSLASHELRGEPYLREEVDTFVRELAVPCPDRFEATRVTVYRLHHPTWTGPWWSTFRWERLRAVPLGRTGR